MIATNATTTTTHHHTSPPCACSGSGHKFDSACDPIIGRVEIPAQEQTKKKEGVDEKKEAKRWKTWKEVEELQEANKQMRRALLQTLRAR